MFRSSVLTVLLMMFGLPANAWNALGHQVIAQIAIHHMTPHALARFAAYERGSQGLLQASVWLDTVRGSWRESRVMHYIDIPYVEGTLTRAPKAMSSMNAVLAVREAMQMLLDANISVPERVIALRVVLHVVGDLHQPLHAINRYSTRYPQSDRGGNLQHLPKNKIGKNLHAYWDRGAGMLLARAHHESFKALVQRVEAASGPCEISATSSLDPMTWAESSHDIARSEIYPAWPAKAHVTKHQRRLDYKRVEQQLADAGCHLALVLNALDRQLNLFEKVYLPSTSS